MTMPRETTRIGLIVPSSNSTVEPEFWKMAPKNVTVHAARMQISENTLEGLRRMEKDAERAASLLSDAAVDVVCYACTSGSFYGGIEHERRLADRLQEAARGIPVITTSQAAMSALTALGVRRVAVATPYIDEINAKLVRFFEENGFDVVKLAGLQIVENLTVGRQGPTAAYDLSKTVDSQEAEAIFISCTNFRTVEIVERLETELGKPATSANVATFWYAMRKIGLTDGQGGLGRLLKMPVVPIRATR
jgi:maleate isomerase